jgi:hypothetical protein
MPKEAMIPPGYKESTTEHNGDMAIPMIPPHGLANATTKGNKDTTTSLNEVANDGNSGKDGDLWRSFDVSQWPSLSEDQQDIGLQADVL